MFYREDSNTPQQPALSQVPFPESKDQLHGLQYVSFSIVFHMQPLSFSSFLKILLES